MDNTALQDQILQLLRQTFGTKVEQVSQKIANQGHDYLVLLIQLCNPSMEIVVKLAGPNSSMAASFKQTALLQRLVGTSTTIPMPEILAVNMSYQDWPWRYLIKTSIPGQEWADVRGKMSSAELSGAYQQIGSAVAQLHRIQFPTFGQLSLDGTIQENKPYLIAFREHARNTIKSASLCDRFFSALEKLEHLFLDIIQPRLCHEDLHDHNILFQFHQGRWHLATILDFDKAWAGHSEIDLARMDFWRGMTNEKFWAAYDEILPREPMIEPRWLIYQLLWCFEVAWNTPEHLKDTQSLCAKLGISCPDRFE
jgi:aminoglycoside phosphotransferase (APT) family kinase protein